MVPVPYTVVAEGEAGPTFLHLWVGTLSGDASQVPVQDGLATDGFSLFAQTGSKAMEFHTKWRHGLGLRMAEHVCSGVEPCHPQGNTGDCP